MIGYMSALLLIPPDNSLPSLKMTDLSYSCKVRGEN